MKRKTVFITACIFYALLFCISTPAFAKRGLPDYVVETGCGDNNTGGAKVLISFATNYGRTFKIAQQIAEVLCQDGYQVDMRFAKNITESELAGYDAVILGSCIYIEKWHEDATAFLEKYQSMLAGKPVAYFCVNALLGMDIPDVAEMVNEYYIQPMYERYPEIQPRAIGAFAGAINYRILLPKDWLMLRLSFMPGGDWTDGEAVDTWAHDISALLR